jgi:hypothetical protein
MMLITHTKIPATSLLPHNNRESSMSTIAKVIPHDNVPGEAATPRPRKEMSPNNRRRNFRAGLLERRSRQFHICCFVSTIREQESR